MNNKFYTGIGSRNTPVDVQQQMTSTARLLNQLGFVLRSGGADGADTAFEKGASNKEIYLPWSGFNDNKSSLICNDRHIEFFMESKLHPKANVLGLGPTKLHSRNCCQILGYYLDSPTSFVLCWTPDGCEDGNKTTKETGGTGTAIRLATRLGIPVFNMKNEDWITRLQMYMCFNHDVELGY